MKTALVSGVIACRTRSLSIPRVRGSMSTKTGVKPHWITDAMSETQVIAGTITSPTSPLVPSGGTPCPPAVSRNAARVMRFADDPELTSTLCLTPSHADHSSSNARTWVDWVRIGPPSPSSSESNRTTSRRSARLILFFIKGQSREVASMVLMVGALQGVEILSCPGGDCFTDLGPQHLQRR